MATLFDLVSDVRMVLTPVHGEKYPAGSASKARFSLIRSSIRGTRIRDHEVFAPNSKHCALVTSVKRGRGNHLDNHRRSGSELKTNKTSRRPL